MADAGAVYLFSTNGTLLTTFTNPTPASFDNFGYSLAEVGNNWVLIGAPTDDTAARNAGAAYLFTTNGTLLYTFSKNIAAPDDYFGHAVATVGNHRILISAFASDIGATDSGAAYLFELPYPPLAIKRSESDVFIQWVADETGLILQQTTALGPSASWNDISESILTTGTTNNVQQAINPTNHLYRLRRP